MNIYSSVMHEVLNTGDKKLSPHNLVKKGLKKKELTNQYRRTKEDLQRQSISI